MCACEGVMSVTIPFCCSYFPPRRRRTCTCKGQRSRIKSQVRNCMSQNMTVAQGFWCNQGVDILYYNYFTNGVNIISKDQGIPVNFKCNQSRALDNFNFKHNFCPCVHLNLGPKASEATYKCLTPWCTCTNISTVLWNWPVKSQQTCYMLCLLCAQQLSAYAFTTLNLSWMYQKFPSV